MKSSALPEFWISLVVDLLASGMRKREILKVYADLEPEDIQACIDYGAEMSRERYVDIPLKTHDTTSGN